MSVFIYLDYSNTLVSFYVLLLDPKILVVGGRDKSDFRYKTELWSNPAKKQCDLPDFPVKINNGGIGFNTLKGPAVCSSYSKQCFIFQHHQWMPFTNMTTLRSFASAIEVENGQTLIIGGRKYDAGSAGWIEFNTTELISSSGSEEHNHLPVTISEHCSFKINATHALITGGKQRRSTSPRTWFVDLNSTTFKKGPNMKTRRHGHGCSVFQHGTKSYGIISGGWNGGYLDSTEIIILDEENPSWTEGMEDKSKIVYL